MSKTVRFQGGPVQDSNQDFNQDHQVILALCSLCFAIPTNSEFSTSPLSRCARSGLHAQVDWDFTLRAPRNRRKTCTLLGPWTLLPLLVIEGPESKEASGARECARLRRRALRSGREGGTRSVFVCDGNCVCVALIVAKHLSGLLGKGLWTRDHT